MQLIYFSQQVFLVPATQNNRVITFENIRFHYRRNILSQGENFNF